MSIKNALKNLSKSKKNKSEKPNKKKISARQIAKNITKGVFPKQHLRAHTLATLQAELFSLRKSYKPQTMTNDEWKKWTKKFNIIQNHIDDLPTKDQRSINSEVNKMLGQKT